MRPSWFGWVRSRTWRAGASVALTAALAYATNLITGDNPAVVWWVFGAVFLTTLVGLEVWNHFDGGRDEARARLDARAQVLGALRPPTAMGAIRVLEALTATGSPTPLWGRRAELAALLGWCAEEGGRVRIVSGPAGVGKTRLALALAEEMVEQGWCAGWALSLDGLVEKVAACGEKALVLVDDADRWAGVEVLLTQAAQRPDLVRVLLIARDGSALRDRLRARPPATVGLLLADEPMELAPIGLEGDRIRWFDEATRAYAGQFRYRGPLPSPNAVGADGDTLLLLHARALIAVVDQTGAHQLTLPQIADHLMRLERGRWSDDPAAPAGVALLTDVVAVLTLLPILSLQDAASMLVVVPDLAGDDAQALRFACARCARWARETYGCRPDGRLDLRPHLIADYLISRHFRQDPVLLGALPTVGAAAALVALARACVNVPEAASMFVIAAATNPSLLWPALVAITIADLTSDRLDAALATLIDATAPEFVPARRDLSGLGRHRHVVRALTQAAVVRARTAGSAADLARALTELGDRLSEVGKAEQSLAAGAEAVRTWRRIPGHRRRLADALTDLGARLEAVGRKRETVAPYEEAAGLWRQLVDDHPDDLDVSASLGFTLVPLGRQLAEADRRGDALTVCQEAVEIGRRLVNDRPEDALHRDLLGRALICLGDRLAEVGQAEQALAVQGEAAEIWRRLVADRPQGYDFRDQLALALTRCGHRLAYVGEPGRAITTYEEAVEIRRQLVRDRPGKTVYRSGLAATLGSLHDVLTRTRHHEQALTVCQEMVGTCRQLVDDQPHNPEYRHNLAAGLAGYGTLLAKIGRKEQALPFQEKAADLFRRLADDQPRNPDARSSLAGALVNLANIQADVGRKDQALAAGEQAIGTFRLLAEEHPDDPMYRNNLAVAHNATGIVLARIGHYRQAVVAYRNAVEIWRQLAGEQAQNRDYRDRLANTLGNLGIILRHGQDLPEDEVLALRREVVGIWRELAHQDPSGYATRHLREQLLLDGELDRRPDDSALPDR
ncbi:tetratricopeptide repeat protein [Amycolatopsis sp. NPDC048633]|uniref:tetratricopeptide repeat protein n=1 Tax=Amycolatopsis sp. NPDC048633 TaxID=3157095 RepID=UPI0033FE9E7C